ncbi:MAG: efflux RND transporter periplasmic adaptor subunit [Nitrospinae bacterium]|nr:efflux RND transporter periplasmic adaptor subunit [Nitrospinota bacterium]
MKYLLILVVVAALGYVGYDRYTRVERTPVKTVSVTRGEVVVTVSTVFTGSVVSEREATLSFQAAGQLAHLAVQGGEMVTIGEVVARLDDVEAKAQVMLAEANVRVAQAHHVRVKVSLLLEDSQVRAEIEQSQASLENAASTYRRWQELFAKGAVAKQQVEEGQMRYETAKSRYEAAVAARARNTAKQQEVAAAEAAVMQMDASRKMARIRLEQTVLHAPFAGLVTRTFAHAGEFVGIGKPILHLADPTSLHVKAVVDEADTRKLRVGQRALVTMDAFPGRKLEGRVTEVSPVILTARQESRTAEVKIQFDERALPLKAGFSADIEIIVARASNVLRLPTHMILERERGKYVYRVTDSRAREVPIRIGASNWDFTEIAGGIREGERVAIPLDGRKLEDGHLVRVLE